MVNNVCSDQTPLSVASDQRLHVCHISHCEIKISQNLAQLVANSHQICQISQNFQTILTILVELQSYFLLKSHRILSNLPFKLAKPHRFQSTAFGIHGSILFDQACMSKVKTLFRNVLVRGKVTKKSQSCLPC